MYTIRNVYFVIKESRDDEIDYLALQVYDGNMAAFDKMDRYLRPQVIRMSYKYVNHYHPREDIEQDMMEIALRLCYRYERELGRYRNYLYRTIRFEMFGRLREYDEMRKREYQRKNRWITFETGDHIDVDSNDPMDILVRGEQIQHLLSEEGLCSTLERRVLHHLYLGWTVSEICTEMSLGRKSVMNTLHRIKRKKDHLLIEDGTDGTFDNMA